MPDGVLDALTTVGAVLGGLLLAWLVALAVLWRLAPEQAGLRSALRLVPDLVGLVRRLAADPALGRGVRLRLWLLIGYLASPIDLVPDMVPVLGWADDLVLVVLVLRSVLRTAGPDAVARHWRGTAEGLLTVLRLAG